MSELLLSLRGVDLKFASNIYRAVSWREAFTRVFKRPPEFHADEVLHVCRKVSFEVRRGERVAILGANGAGKTSLCRAIAGIYRPSGGEILRFGMIRALFDATTVVQSELTGRENAHLLAKLNFPAEDMKQEVEEALAFSELGRFLDVPLRTYSKGMMARLGLSLATMRGADILILDEVFDGADVFFREKISRRTLDMMDKSGAVLFISHSPDQIRRVCNRVLVLRDGQIAFDGAVDAGLSFLTANLVSSPGAEAQL